MKKLIFFTFFILSLLIFKSNVLFAQQPTDSTNSAQTVTQVEYTLPYPGLLPDSPLYFLKAIRDRIVGFLISDPLKKTEFDLLQADKRLNEGIFLFKKGESKYNLAESTISKGENYFNKALGELNQAKRQGEAISDIAPRLYKSSLKHQEIIKNLIDKTKGDLKQKLIGQEKRVENFQREVKNIIPK